MRVLKIVLEGTTTSFRYPHFILTAQPSFPMPPPATIYGHICSALGEIVDPEGIQFAYHFTSAGAAEDLEHIHALSASSGKLPGSKIPKVLEGNTTPYRREILLHPRLVLYLNKPEWYQAFRVPRYPVLLGRSQDLACYSSIEIIELEQHQQVYFEHTLLPYEWATKQAKGVVSLMPRWIPYPERQNVSFARYVMLQQRILSTDLQHFGTPPADYLADPTIRLTNNLALGLVFHTFVGDEHETITMA